MLLHSKKVDNRIVRMKFLRNSQRNQLNESEFFLTGLAQLNEVVHTSTVQWGTQARRQSTVWEDLAVTTPDMCLPQALCLDNSLAPSSQHS
jgi:hypothetical protein